MSGLKVGRGSGVPGLLLQVHQAVAFSCLPSGFWWPPQPRGSIPLSSAEPDEVWAGDWDALGPHGVWGRCPQCLIQESLLSGWWYTVCVFSLVLFFCDPMDYSLPGSSVHGILQPRILEWVAMPSSRGSSRPKDWTHISCISCIGRRVLYHCTSWEAWRHIVGISNVWYHFGVLTASQDLC